MADTSDDPNISKYQFKSLMFLFNWHCLLFEKHEFQPEIIHNRKHIGKPWANGYPHSLLNMIISKYFVYLKGRIKITGYPPNQSASARPCSDLRRSIVAKQPYSKELVVSNSNNRCCLWTGRPMEWIGKKRKHRIEIYLQNIPYSYSLQRIEVDRNIWSRSKYSKPWVRASNNHGKCPGSSHDNLGFPMS